MVESVIGAEILKIPERELYYWREGSHEVDSIVKTPSTTFAIEIKASRPPGQSQGILAFAKKYPHIHCEVWDRSRCLQFLQGQHEKFT